MPCDSAITCAMLRTPIGRLRAIGILEGISYLALLGIAMPLKYMADQPEPVKILGWIHGGLFMALCLALLHVHWVTRWGTLCSAGVFVAAFLPFGPFVIDSRLKEKDQQLQVETNPQ